MDASTLQRNLGGYTGSTDINTDPCYGRIIDPEMSYMCSLGPDDTRAPEDENLWIASRLIWFDQPRPPDSSSDVPKSRSASRQLAHRLLQSGLDHNPKVFF
ncbi:hypothetical protein STEG23_023927, partial [Scotinomys teguina]